MGGQLGRSGNNVQRGQPRRHIPGGSRRRRDGGDRPESTSPKWANSFRSLPTLLLGARVSPSNRRLRARFSIDVLGAASHPCCRGDAAGDVAGRLLPKTKPARFGLTYCQRGLCRGPAVPQARLGRLLVEDSITRAPLAGFDAIQFKFRLRGQPGSFPLRRTRLASLSGRYQMASLRGATQSSTGGAVP